MAGNGKAPPAGVVRVVDKVRDRVRAVHRRMVPPPVAMLELIMGSMVTQALYVAAKLGIADVLKDGPLPPKDIAERVGADPDAVNRLLRALASQGLFRGDGQRYELTSLGDVLRTDSEVSMRAMALMIGSPEHWEHWGHLLDSVRDGQEVVSKLRGMDLWEYLQHNKAFGTVFNEAMTSVSAFAKAPVLAVYDFSPFSKIVDVGGGHGSLLASILQRTPNAEGVLFDLPSVTAGAQQTLTAYGVRERCAVESGSFFETIPAGGDAYILKNIIHDWAEDKAQTILRNVRAAIEPAGRLLLIEFVVPDGNDAHPAKIVDLEMLLQVGGRERTEHEYRQFLARAGFRLDRVVHTASPLCVLESTPV